MEAHYSLPSLPPSAALQAGIAYDTKAIPAAEKEEEEGAIVMQSASQAS